MDYRIDDPDGDGKTKLAHGREMLTKDLTDKGLPFRGGLMDSGYAERKRMVYIERFDKDSTVPSKTIVRSMKRVASAAISVWMA
jgi:hypothetical protein